MKHIDAIILAGTKGTAKLKTDERSDHKPYIEICGKTLVEYVIDAAMDCPELRTVYVVTDFARLNHVLHMREFKDPQRKLRIVPDEGSIIENLRETVSCHLLPENGHEIFHYDHQDREEYIKRNPGSEDLTTVVLYGDSPFLTGADISRFIETSDPFADYTVGFAREEELSAVEQEIGEKLCIPETKTGLFPFGNTSIRANNMAIGKPLKVPDEVWQLAQNIYDNRYLLTKKGKENKRNWRKIYSVFREYTKSQGAKRPTILYGFVWGAVLFKRLYRAHRKGAAESLSKEDFEMAGFHVTGDKCYGSMNICDIAMPAFDVDNAEMLQRLTADDSALFRKLREVPRCYPRNSEQELEQFVAEHDALFTHNEPVDVAEWEKMLSGNGYR